MANYLLEQIRSSWYRADLKARIIYPSMIILGVLSSLISITIYDTEKKNLLNELDLRGLAISQSLSAFASTTILHGNEHELSNHVYQIMGHNISKQANNSSVHLLHSVEFRKKDKPFLIVNNDSLRHKIQPHTLKHYNEAILLPNNKDPIGSVRISLSTQQIDEHLALRVFHLTSVSVLFVVFASLLFSWLLDKIVIQPLQRLGHKIQILMGHKFNQEISTSSWDEIGSLFQNLNRLRLRMKKDQQNDLTHMEQDLDRVATGQFNASDLASTVMIVDDDRVIQIYLEKLLEKNYMNTICASNGLEALKLLEDTRVDLILLDLWMPGISGFDVLESLQADKKLNSIPVIVVSSNQEKKSAIKALNKGAVDYIMKPVNKNELMARINTHLKVALREKELEHIISERIASLREDI